MHAICVPLVTAILLKLVDRHPELLDEIATL
jgi:hypothetical protein